MNDWTELGFNIVTLTGVFFTVITGQFMITLALCGLMLAFDISKG